MASGGNREKVGVKKALVFYRGKPPKGLKTNWIMHEYRLADAASSTTSRPPCNVVGGKATASLRLDDWVLCRIFNKINKIGAGERSMECEDSVEDAVAAYPTHAAAAMAAVAGGGRAAHHNGNNYTSLIHHHHEDNFLDGFITAEDTGISAGASSLSQLAAAARAAAPADTKQLLVPSSSTTPFNWLDASAFAHYTTTLI